MANAQEQRRQQISIPIDDELRAAIERRAQAEHRSMASLVRHIVAQALETKAQQMEAA